MDDDNLGCGIVVVIVGLLVCIVGSTLCLDRIASALERAYPKPAAAEVQK